MEKVELKIGQKVYLKPTRANKACKKDFEVYEVKWVGDVYFEVWRDNDIGTKLMFHRQSLKQISSAPTLWRLYLNVQDMLDEAETKEIVNMLKKKLSGKVDLSLDQLRQIKKIIE